MQIFISGFFSECIGKLNRSGISIVPATLFFAFSLFTFFAIQSQTAAASSAAAAAAAAVDPPLVFVSVTTFTVTVLFLSISS